MNTYAQIRTLVWPLLLFSFVTNMAVLISPLFMMQVLDRVLPSGNTATLLLLGLLALGALVLQAISEGARDNSLGRLSRWTERYGTGIALFQNRSDPQGFIDKVASFTQFLGGPTVLAALNIPWIPLICFVLFLVHPNFLLLLVLLVAASWTSQFMVSSFVSSDETRALQIRKSEQLSLTNASNFKAKTGMAMIAHRLRHRFYDLQGQRHQILERSQNAQSVGSSVNSYLRSAGQILALGLGAFLVATEQLSAGGMIAASILLAKGFATIESAVNQLPAIRNAYQTYQYLCAQPGDISDNTLCVDSLSGQLRADGLVVPRGGGAPPRLDRVSFQLQSGECLAVIGSSGSGKTTLLKALSGLEPAPIGSVFWEQSELRGLTDQDIYKASGYLPQQAGLVPGTIAENIASFDRDLNDQMVVSAAKTAGVHGLISALPNSYNTDLSQDMHLLSAGQSQRVALARALYNKPKYLFLDEPNALLDADGEKALAQTLLRLKESGTTIIMILHRSGIMGLADKVMRLERGRIVDFGNRPEVMKRLGLGGRRIELPILMTSIDDLRDWIASQFTRSSDDDFSLKAQAAALELFKVACHSESNDAPRIASFFFTFVDDANCEVSMVEDLPNEVESRVASVKARLRKKETFVSDFSPEEAAIAAITKLSEQFKVHSTEEATHFTVSLKNENAHDGHIAERLN